MRAKHITMIDVSRLPARMFFLAGMLVLLLSAHAEMQGRVRSNMSFGSWNDLQWIPSGLPEPEDTVIINGAVTGIPGGAYAALVIQSGASLTASPGVYQVDDLRVYGDLVLLPGAVMKVRGDALNNGLVRDAGALELVKSGGALSGTGSISNLIVNAGPGAILRLGSRHTLGSLYVAAGELRIDSNDLTVNAAFTSVAPHGDPGIVATTGVITLNGPVHGSARGPVRLGWVTGGGTPKKPMPPTTYGTLGAAGDTVRFTAARTVAFGELVGTVVIDSGAVVTAEGIGAKGINAIRGTLWNRGRLTARDRGYHWQIDGDLENRGEIDDCIILMTGHDAALRTDSGTWGFNTSLAYRATSGGVLHLAGSITVPRLEISPFTPLDSNVVVDAGSSEILVRHRFFSDAARGCRLLSDTIVHFRGDAEGIVEADVSFEGFFGSEIAGRFGVSGRTVSLAMPKHFARPVTIVGTLAQTPNATLTVRSEASLPSGTELKAHLVLDTSAVLSVDGALTIARNASGGGTLELIGPTPSLDVRGTLADSILLRVGRDTAVSALSVARSFSVPRMTVHPNSSLVYPPDVRVDVTGEVRYRVAVLPGYSMMSAAVRPADPAPSAVFPGTDSPVYMLDSTEQYVVVDSIEPGVGYWMSFPTAGIIEQVGTMMNPPAASTVHHGWNIIGGASVPVDVADFVELLTTKSSQVFEHISEGDPNAGYSPVPLLEPGRGYLVRFDGNGIVVRQ